MELKYSDIQGHENLRNIRSWEFGLKKGQTPFFVRDMEERTTLNIVFHVTMVTFLMTLLMNKLASIITPTSCYFTK